MGRAQGHSGAIEASGFDALLGVRRGSTQAQAARDLQERAVAGAQRREARIGELLGLLSESMSGVDAVGRDGLAELYELGVRAGTERYQDLLGALEQMAEQSFSGARPEIELLSAADAQFTLGPGMALLALLHERMQQGKLSEADAALAVERLFSPERPEADRVACEGLAGALADWLERRPERRMPARSMASVMAASEPQVLAGVLASWFEVITRRIEEGFSEPAARADFTTALARVASVDADWRGHADQIAFQIGWTGLHDALRAEFRATASEAA